MASRYKILREKVEPEPVASEPVKTKIVVPAKQRLIRAREIGSESQFECAVEADLIKNLKIIERNVKTVYSKQCPEGYELVRAEYDIIDPKSEWSQEFLKKTRYYNEFEIIYPKFLKSIDMEALTEHLQNHYAEELDNALDNL